MNIKKFIVQKILERWVAKVPENNIQGVMNKANVMLWKEGRCQVGLELEERHTNSRETLHTGIAILLADVTCALALFSHPKVLEKITYPFSSLTVPSTVNLNFSFLDSSARIGNGILVDANVETIEVNNVLRFGCDDSQGTNGPLASLAVSISSTESNIVLAKGDMLMHIGALAEDK